MTKRSRAKKAWWQTMFNEKYIRTYVDNVTPARTEKEQAFIRKHLRLAPGAKILDLACGDGRHTIALAKRGYQLTGLDYSPHFIALAREAAKKEKVGVKFIRGDMRRLSFVRQFDAVLSMFTSFGYFNESDNERVLRLVALSLKRGGYFILDVNNTLRRGGWFFSEGRKDRQTGNPVVTTRKRLSNGLLVADRHSIDPVTMRAKSTCSWREHGHTQSYSYTVRMYTAAELTHLLIENGLVVKRVWGDFNGSSYTPMSWRIILLAKKK